MKKYLFVLILIVVNIQVLYPQNYKELFKKGVNLYEGKKYQEAIIQFQKILDQNRENGEIFFNMGNCYFRLGKTGQAILYYEKATRYMGTDPDLVYNLDLARKQIQNPIIVPPKIFIIRWWNFLIANLPVDILGYSMLFLSFLALAISFLLVQFRSKSWIPLLANLRKLIFIILVTVLVLTVIRVGFLHENRFAVIINGKTGLKSEPLEESKDLIFIPEGTKVKILRGIDNWLEIELPDGNKGWLKLEQIGTI